MSEPLESDKNRITCPAKIRTRDSQFGRKRLLEPDLARKAIVLPSADSTGSPTHEQPESDLTYFLLNDPFPLPGTLQQSEESEVGRSSHRLNFLYDSWFKTENEEMTSQISRGELTKRSEFADFPDFDRNPGSLTFQKSDSSFDEGSRILYSFPFDALSKDFSEVTRECTLLEKTVEDKAPEVSSQFYFAKYERKSLEKRIFDLEFQLFTQRKNSDRLVEDLTAELKNVQ